MTDKEFRAIYYKLLTQFFDKKDPAVADRLEDMTNQNPELAFYVEQIWQDDKAMNPQCRAHPEFKPLEEGI